MWLSTKQQSFHQYMVKGLLLYVPAGYQHHSYLRFEHKDFKFALLLRRPEIIIFHFSQYSPNWTV